jgi:ribonuclease HI
MVLPSDSYLPHFVMMHASLPHYLLQAETYRSGRGLPRWRFNLQAVGSDQRLTAADNESTVRRSRLELLAVVRGLEALDAPSRVTLLTRSRYVSSGIRRQLAQWRANNWQWERFGEMTQIRDYDLWRRIDRALEFHTVECCVWQTAGEPAHDSHGTARPATLANTLTTLGRGILSPLSSLWRPAFTRAA